MSVGTGAYSTPMKHDLATLVGSATQPCSRSCVKRANTDGDPFIRCSSACENGPFASWQGSTGFMQVPGCDDQIVGDTDPCEIA
jgi:hypothetical protein